MSSPAESDGQDTVTPILPVVPPIKAMDEYFEAHMKQPGRNNIFRDWETYKATLPIDDETKMPLAEFPYWATETEVQTIYHGLVTYSRDRQTIGYISAPSGSGKSACVLPMFLHSTTAVANDFGEEKGFTHYVYLPFDKNGGHHFKPMEYAEDDERTYGISDHHGEMFMLEVLERALKGKKHTKWLPWRRQIPAYNSRIPIQVDIPDDRHPQREINALIASIFPKDARVLFHMDEHGEMSKNHYFRRGAFSVLARVPNCKVIATYTERPIQITPSGGGYVCRRPVPLPLPNINMMAKTHRALDLARIQPPPPKTQAYRDCRRLMAIVQCRTACFFSQRLTQAHAGKLEPVFRRLEHILAMHEAKQSNEAPSTPQIRATLQQYLNILVAFDANRSTDNRFGTLVTTQYDDALTLMEGYTDMDAARLRRKLCRLPTSIDGYMIVPSWMELITMENGDFPAFNKARDEFVSVALQESDVGKFAASPLKRAYLWSLLCHSQKNGEIDFHARTGTSIFDIEDFKAEDFKFGRLFLGGESVHDYMVDPSSLEKNIIYAAAEYGIPDSIPNDHGDQLRFIYLKRKKLLKRNPNDPAQQSQIDKKHPWCDLFFVAKYRGLVMISIVEGEIANQDTRLFQFLYDRLAKCGVYRVTAIALAPAMEGGYEVKRKGSVNVMILKGENAREQLGALEQLYP
eukprot:CAMPEP_0119553568 /NCGR_PEP_ID=MMETSP1352-20130426/6292_1 /TAXON_ID=265584 /ORGANISM="Stauroneis constricta, Strain CCMP1120" /LENGTH=687 /DNA_ID=CAMNT_0007600003 /DNA_START=761 /DNA_END=2820 /DNA_ORIENTATION=+